MVYQRLSAVLAVIGCVTGVVSLSWQIYDSYAIPRESISVGEVFRSSEVVMPDKTRKIEWRFLIPITNVGKEDAYLNVWVQGSKDGRVTLSPIRGEHDDKMPIQPGQVRVYEFGAFTDAQLLEHANSLQQDVSAWVSTSRGKVIPIHGFSSSFTEAVKSANSRMSK